MTQPPDVPDLTALTADVPDLTALTADVPDLTALTGQQRPSAAPRPDHPMTPAVVVLRGLPGAGKSTWAAAYVHDARAEDRWAGVVSRDTVRQHVLGLTMAPDDAVLDPAGEDIVTAVVEAAAGALLAAGCDVVADATHLTSRDVTRWQAIAADHGARVRVVDLRVPAEECIRRDSARAAAGGRSVGAAVIRRMAASARPTYEEGVHDPHPPRTRGDQLQ